MIGGGVPLLGETTHICIETVSSLFLFISLAASSFNRVSETTVYSMNDPLLGHMIFTRKICTTYKGSISRESVQRRKDHLSVVLSHQQWYEKVSVDRITFLGHVVLKIVSTMCETYFHHVHEPLSVPGSCLVHLNRDASDHFPIRMLSLDVLCKPATMTFLRMPMAQRMCIQQCGHPIQPPFW